MSTFRGELHRNDPFIDDLDLHRDPSVEAVLARLRRLADQRFFDAATVRKLYDFLDQEYEAHASLIDSSFNEEPLFFLPGERPRYLPRSMVFWQDVGPIFGESRGCLGEHWSDMRRFFIHKLEVPLRPSPEDYAALLRELTEKDSLTAQQEKVVWAIYRELDRCLGDDGKGLTDNSWWREFVCSGVFWTDRNEFWANEEDLFVNDRDELYELFRGQHGIAFLKLPTNQHPHFARFLRAAGIPLVSEAVKIEPVPSHSQQGHAGLSARCRLMVPFIIRYLFHREQDSFREWQGTGAVARLGEIEVRVCDGLQVSATLRGVCVPVQRRFGSRFPTVFVSRGSEDDLDGLAAELARMLKGSPGLEMFIAAALSRGDASAIERLMQAQAILELPAEEEDLAEPAVVRQESGTEDGSDDTAGSLESEWDGQAEETLADEAPSGWEELPANSGSGTAPVIPDATRLVAQTGGKTVPFSLLNKSDVPTLSGPADPDGIDEVSDGSAGGSDSDRGPTQGVSLARGRLDKATAAPATWSPAYPPDEARVVIRDVVPSVVAERTAASRGTLAGEGHPSAGPEGFEDPTPSPYAVAIGRWGEQYGVSCLRDEVAARHPTAEIIRVSSGYHFLSGGTSVAEVRWLNWEQDKGVGCDVEVIEGGTTEFVEVKATADESKANFEVTAAQWRLARQQGPAYRILRVFNAGIANTRAESYRDPVRLWQEGRLAARLLQIVI